MARIPFDPADFRRYYTVELRLKEGWDRGIPRDTLLIHEVRSNGLSYLIKSNGGPERLPGSSFTDSANGLQISVLSLNPTLGQATITIESNIALRCLAGYLWREAGPGDYVCVTAATRAQTLYDNSQASSRVQPGGGGYGSDTCITGYVWREAFPNDHVCVTYPTRLQAQNDNGQAANRVVPFVS